MYMIIESQQEIGKSGILVRFDKTADDQLM